MGWNCSSIPKLQRCNRWSVHNFKEVSWSSVTDYSMDISVCIWSALVPTVLCWPHHWGQVRHICISKLTNIDSYYGLLPGQCQAIIWTNAGVLLIRIVGTNFSEILSKIQTFSFKTMHLKLLSGKWWPFCLSVNVLSVCGSDGCISHSGGSSRKLVKRPEIIGFL